MFAILITPETIPKILKECDLSVNDLSTVQQSSNKKRYFIRGYVNKRGALYAWTILPAKSFVNVFEHDPNKIKTDWDQIVRIPTKT